MSLFRSLAIGCATGLRSMSPLAIVGLLRRRTPGSAAPSIMDHPAVKVGLAALALAEAAGDKLPSAPDRIVPAGICARLITGGIAGASLAPRRQRRSAAVIGAAGAMGAAYLGLYLRRRAMRRFGQTSTGLIEDGLAAGASVLAARGAR